MTNILKNFWVLEGLDGAGTTTQLHKIEEKLLQIGKRFFITQEPTENEIGKFLRRVLSGEISVPQSSVAHLFAADRDDHLYNTKYGITNHLNNGEIVVSDRYFFSSLAYQSIGFDYDFVKTLNSRFPYPEFVIFIDTPPESCMKRIDARGNKREIYEKYEYQKLVHQNYLRCLSELPAGCTLISVNGDKTVEEISAEIFEKLQI